ncbi:hypothetical protein ACIRQP_24615 [Streptomyces sp. NPDC102274]|uniref:hypothetical protein n=1 Tax=Streptomyces sp. NPDC102274 TaxID=3366151 RepID=UPI0038254E7F
MKMREPGRTGIQVSSYRPDSMMSGDEVLGRIDEIVPPAVERAAPGRVARAAPSAPRAVPVPAAVSAGERAAGVTR